MTEAERNFLDQSEYLRYVQVPEVRNEVLMTSVATIRDGAPAFDALVATGNSGVSFGAMLAMLLDVPLVIVRKNNEDQHGYTKWEGPRGIRVLFVDDFVSDGETYRRVAAEAKFNKCEVVGAFLYAQATVSMQDVRSRVQLPYVERPRYTEPGIESSFHVFDRARMNPEVSNL